MYSNTSTSTSCRLYSYFMCRACLCINHDVLYCFVLCCVLCVCCVCVCVGGGGGALWLCLCMYVCMYVCTMCEYMCVCFSAIIVDNVKCLLSIPYKYIYEIKRNKQSNNNNNNKIIKTSVKCSNRR